MIRGDIGLTKQDNTVQDKNVFSDCGCRFESDESNVIILCEECSKLLCHNPLPDAPKEKV